MIPSVTCKVNFKCPHLHPPLLSHLVLDNFDIDVKRCGKIEILAHKINHQWVALRNGSSFAKQSVND